uniref:Uncharacterized protein n=1 Tax=Fagus sylvatica TaxID=28930 RepID=A0A2N9HZ69_FAGSY
MMFPHHGRSYTSGLTWQNGKMLLGEDTLQRQFQDSVLDRFYTLEQESGRMTIARFKSGLRYEIKKEMSHRYLEDVEDAIETAIQFEKGQPAETPKQMTKFPQTEARKLEQDADRSEQFAKKVEQLKEHVVNPKQQVHELGQHATKSREPREQAKEPTQQTETSRQLGDDSKQQLESLMEEKSVDENSFEQIHEIQGKNVKFAFVGKEIDKPATIHPTVVPNTSQPVTHIILQQEKIETKEYIMMKEEIEEMDKKHRYGTILGVPVLHRKSIPMLQHVP